MNAQTATARTTVFRIVTEAGSHWQHTSEALVARSVINRYVDGEPFALYIIEKTGGAKYDRTAARDWALGVLGYENLTDGHRTALKAWKALGV